MPLITSNMLGAKGGDDKTSQWMNKLMGKKLGESSNETTFAKSELPKEHRIVKDGDMTTMDHKPDRLNIHTGDDGTVQKITHG
ncbi:hypothetical protein LTR08_008999 [Meristemomyces frigidus]|nr:hypothetical protein LTR08_008999 [Meristemomyces frigidus]